MQLIQQEADRRGGLTFARFMELALYAPGLGYYERSDKGIGRQGDFFTSVSVGPLFGELLACQFAGWLRERDQAPAVIVEAGAHDGQLAADILTAGTTRHVDTFNRLEYWLVEPSPSRAARQRETLYPFARQVRWFQSWTDLSAFCDSTGHRGTTVIFSNELLDAFPVHRLRWNRGEQRWNELGVRFDGGRLEWQISALSREVEQYGKDILRLTASSEAQPLWPRIPAELLACLPDGFTIEVSPGALNWWRDASEGLCEGWLVAFDYGLEARDFFAPQRGNGTLRACHRHRWNQDLLASPGQQDLTAHVNFSVLRQVGEKAGLQTDYCGDQAAYLTRIAAALMPPERHPFSPVEARQFHTLTHPSHLGHAFRVIVQTRGVRAVG